MHLFLANQEKYQKKIVYSSKRICELHDSGKKKTKHLNNSARIKLALHQSTTLQLVTSFLDDIFTLGKKKHRNFTDFKNVFSTKYSKKLRMCRIFKCKHSVLTRKYQRNLQLTN